MKVAGTARPPGFRPKPQVRSGTVSCGRAAHCKIKCSSALITYMVNRHRACATVLHILQCFKFWNSNRAQSRGAQVGLRVERSLQSTEGVGRPHCLAPGGLLGVWKSCCPDNKYLDQTLGPNRAPAAVTCGCNSPSCHIPMLFLRLRFPKSCPRHGAMHTLWCDVSLLPRSSFRRRVLCASASRSPATVQLVFCGHWSLKETPGMVTLSLFAVYDGLDTKPVNKRPESICTAGILRSHVD